MQFEERRTAQLSMPSKSKERSQKLSIPLVETETIEGTYWLTRKRQKVAVAALCKAVLDPREFNNYKFWELIYNGKNQNFVLPLLDKIQFKNGRDTFRSENSCFLGAHGSVHYYACWPDLIEVVIVLRTVFNKNEMFHLLSSCYFGNDSQKITAAINSAYRYNLASSSSPEDNPPDLPNVPVPNNNLPNVPNDPTLQIGYVGYDLNFHPSSAAVMLKILAGFMAAVGAGALILAFTTLSTPTATVAAVAGISALAGSYGLFRYAKNLPLILDNQRTNPAPFP